MKLPTIYNKLSEIPELIDIFSWPFDFEKCDPYLLSSNGWPISLSEELIVVAEEGSGGVYTLKQDVNDPDKSPIIFISSEGQAGKVAENLTEFLCIITAMPYWRDLLKFSAGGKLEEMRLAVPFLEKETLDNEPNINETQELITANLNLPILNSPIEKLHSAVVSGIEMEIKADDGTPFDSLFNTFRVTDNPSWQN